jgi:hypothetical protein
LTKRFARPARHLLSRLALLALLPPTLWTLISLPSLITLTTLPTLLIVTLLTPELTLISLSNRLLTTLLTLSITLPAYGLASGLGGLLQGFTRLPDSFTDLLHGAGNCARNRAETLSRCVARLTKGLARTRLPGSLTCLITSLARLTTDFSAILADRLLKLLFLLLQLFHSLLSALSLVAGLLQSIVQSLLECLRHLLQAGNSHYSTHVVVSFFTHLALRLGLRTRRSFRGLRRPFPLLRRLAVRRHQLLP